MNNHMKSEHLALLTPEQRERVAKYLHERVAPDEWAWYAELMERINDLLSILASVLGRLGEEETERKVMERNWKDADKYAEEMQEGVERAEAERDALRERVTLTEEEARRIRKIPMHEGDRNDLLAIIKRLTGKGGHV